MESHQDVVMRYLVESDKILKVQPLSNPCDGMELKQLQYCNELSMTIDLDSTLTQHWPKQSLIPRLIPIIGQHYLYCLLIGQVIYKLYLLYCISLDSGRYYLNCVIVHPCQ